MSPPLLVMLEPVLSRIAPAPLPSRSLLNTTFSRLVVALMATFEATSMSLCARRVSVLSTPPDLVMSALTAILPASPTLPLEPVAGTSNEVSTVTLVPALRLALMVLAWPAPMV